MPDTKPQSYANHSRFDPWFHFFLAPVLILTFLGTIVHLVRHPHLMNGWHVILAFALIVLAVKCRTYALKVQDRVIRLEERMRLHALLAEPLRARIGELDVKQLVALRFASDAEVPALVQKTLDEKLDPKQIKQAIQNWRGDYLRV
ncbi:MAG TPA: DUF6526 family protein [Acidobacteriaceae bacterium]|jgi:hypothetical protein|nr:DUF6526 family protein [Acidobacteriaceae bacterium]